MSYQSAKASFATEIEEIRSAGLWKTERVIASDQKNDITLEDGSNVVNMCANNYLGLAEHPEVAASLQRHALVTISDRFADLVTSFELVMWGKA